MHGCSDKIFHNMAATFSSGMLFLSLTKNHGNKSQDEYIIVCSLFMKVLYDRCKKMQGCQGQAFSINLHAFSLGNSTISARTLAKVNFCYGSEGSLVLTLQWTASKAYWAAWKLKQAHKPVTQGKVALPEAEAGEHCLEWLLGKRAAIHLMFPPC